ncbi:MAG: hypothetical protein ACHQ53_06160, partial [Polyangiales bacterium]
MNKSLLGILALALSMMTASACKDSGATGGGQTGGTGGADSGIGAAMPSNGSGGAGGTSAGGTGGQSVGTGGTGGSSGTGGVSAAPVACGSATCAGGGFFRGCCVDAAKGTCGVESPLLNVTCDVPAVLDPQCPDHAAVMMMTAKGCCTR